MQGSIAPASRSVAAEARPRWSLPAISLETALYLIILVIACLTRFWDLGAGALHHDESMHAYYSWRYATGFNYIHNPLLHGPLLFHLTALTFLFLPESDATARLMPAIFGVALVGLPWFLRGPRFLGRWGALTASFLLLISPSILYYSRHLRHDLFTLTLTLLLFICIVRYLERPQQRWLITGAAATALMLANHEVIFAILALFFGYLYVVLVIDRILVWWRDDRRAAAQLVLAAHAVLLLGGLAALLLTPASAREEILDIPWQQPTQQQQIDYYQKLATNELVIALLIVVAAAIAILVTGLRRARAGRGTGLLGDAAPESVAAGVHALWRDHAGLGAALLIAVALFVALFTTLFTNLRGLATSTIATNGTLLYWLGQHDVRRGEQPWFYFLTLAPQYEFIALFFGVGAAVAIGVRALGAAFNRWSPGPNLLFRGLLAVWFIGLFTGLSYAGEKMPWLIVHPALPATLLAALVIGAMIERAVPMARNREIGRPEGILLIGLLLAGIAWLALAAMVTQNRITQSSQGIDQRVPGSWGLNHWWLLAIPPGLALLAVAVLTVWRGPQRAALATAAALVIGLSFVQVHASWRMTYLEGDIPRDMLIYTQTAPDVTMLISDFEALSYQTYGDLSMPVYFGGDASWPLWWYLREFPNRTLAASPALPDAVPEGAAIYIVDSVSTAEARDQLDAAFSGYTRHEYVLRWAFPENDTYRQFAIAPEISPSRSAWDDPSNPHGPLDVLASIFDSIGHQLTPEGQQDLYRLIVYRDLTTPLTEWDTRIYVYVRNDLMPVFNGIRY
jgi:predicted membrane-bound mannosyltransferase